MDFCSLDIPKATTRAFQTKTKEYRVGHAIAIFAHSAKVSLRNTVDSRSPVRYRYSKIMHLYYATQCIHKQQSLQ